MFILKAQLRDHARLSTSLLDRFRCFYRCRLLRGSQLAHTCPGLVLPMKYNPPGPHTFNYQTLTSIATKAHGIIITAAHCDQSGPILIQGPPNQASPTAIHRLRTIVGDVDVALVPQQLASAAAGVNVHHLNHLLTTTGSVPNDLTMRHILPPTIRSLVSIRSALRTLVEQRRALPPARPLRVSRSWPAPHSEQWLQVWDCPS